MFPDRGATRLRRGLGWCAFGVFQCGLAAGCASPPVQELLSGFSCDSDVECTAGYFCHPTLGVCVENGTSVTVDSGGPAEPDVEAGREVGAGGSSGVGMHEGGVRDSGVGGSLGAGGRDTGGRDSGAAGRPASDAATRADGSTREDAACGPPDFSPCPATCDDGMRNGEETGIDCGGNCGGCGNGEACNGDGDCRSQRCNAVTMKCVGN